MCEQQKKPGRGRLPSFPSSMQLWLVRHTAGNKEVEELGGRLELWVKDAKLLGMPLICRRHVVLQGIQYIETLSCGLELRVPFPWRTCMSERRVQIVDDHEVVRRGLRDILRDSRFVICGEAENGKQAVEQTLELKPDVVLLDMTMPVMTGLQAAAKIRALAPQTKIIVVTMHDSPQMAEEARAAGANAFLTKSSAGKELLATMSALFEPKYSE